MPIVLDRKSSYTFDDLDTICSGEDMVTVLQEIKERSTKKPRYLYLGSLSRELEYGSTSGSILLISSTDLFDLDEDTFKATFKEFVHQQIEELDPDDEDYEDAIEPLSEPKVMYDRGKETSISWTYKFWGMITQVVLKPLSKATVYNEEFNFTDKDKSLLFYAYASTD